MDFYALYAKNYYVKVHNSKQSCRLPVRFPSLLEILLVRLLFWHPPNHI